MTEANQARYEWGQLVEAAADLYNDGSYPEQPAGALLVRRGEAGEIVQVGQHIETGNAVYMVEFAANRIVGCFEPELEPSPSTGGAQ